MSYRQSMQEAARSYCMAVLDRTGGNVTQAARIAGKNRSDMYKLMRRSGVKVQRHCGVLPRAENPQSPSP